MSKGIAYSKDPSVPTVSGVALDSERVADGAAGSGISFEIAESGNPIQRKSANEINENTRKNTLQSPSFFAETTFD